MSRFVNTQQVKVIRKENWESWETVTVQRWTVRAKDAMNAELIKIAGTAGDIPEVVIQAATVPVLVAGIKTWTFTQTGGEDGALAPVNRHWIGKLDPDDGDFIASEIYAFNGGATEEERQQFFRGAEGSDDDGGDAPA